MSFPEPAQRSYPEPVYRGDTGEASSVLRPATAGPELVRPRGAPGGKPAAAVCRYLATGELTSNQFGLYQWDMPGPVTGPGPHFHRSISESFYVLDGTVRLFDGRAWIDATRGDFLFVPEGGIHGFRNESGEFASMLILFAPGAPREEYFELVGDMASRSEEERAAFMLKHDTFWTE